MKESLLKKEFSESTVQRLRNLVSGEYGASTQTVVGHDRTNIEHEEGDIWEEDGKKWKIEDGIKVSISKLSKARQLAKLPLTCPKCGKPLNTRLDKKMYPIHGICFDCVIRMEDDLKRAGLYKQYEAEMMKGNIEGFVRDMKAKVDYMRRNSDIAFVTSEGEVENYGKVSDEVMNSLDEWAQILIDKVK